MLKIINLPISGIYDTIKYCEAMGFSKIFRAYADNCAGESIECMGLNANRGYTYITLSNGVQIVSNTGRDVEYLTTRCEDGGELWHDSYTEALSSPYITGE